MARWTGKVVIELSDEAEENSDNAKQHGRRGTAGGDKTRATSVRRSRAVTRERTPTTSDDEKLAQSEAKPAKTARARHVVKLDNDDDGNSLDDVKITAVKIAKKPASKARKPARITKPASQTIQQNRPASKQKASRKVNNATATKVEIDEKKDDVKKAGNSRDTSPPAAGSQQRPIAIDAVDDPLPDISEQPAPLPPKQAPKPIPLDVEYSEPESAGVPSNTAQRTEATKQSISISEKPVEKPVEPLPKSEAESDNDISGTSEAPRPSSQSSRRLVRGEDRAPVKKVSPSQHTTTPKPSFAERMQANRTPTFSKSFKGSAKSSTNTSIPLNDERFASDESAEDNESEVEPSPRKRKKPVIESNTAAKKRRRIRDSSRPSSAKKGARKLARRRNAVESSSDSDGTEEEVSEIPEEDFVVDDSDDIATTAKVDRRIKDQHKAQRTSRRKPKKRARGDDTDDVSEGSGSAHSGTKDSAHKSPKEMLAASRRKSEAKKLASEKRKNKVVESASEHETDADDSRGDGSSQKRSSQKSLPIFRSSAVTTKPRKARRSKGSLPKSADRSNQKLFRSDDIDGDSGPSTSKVRKAQKAIIQPPTDSEAESSLNSERSGRVGKKRAKRSATPASGSSSSDDGTSASNSSTSPVKKRVVSDSDDDAPTSEGSRNEEDEDDLELDEHRTHIIPQKLRPATQKDSRLAKYTAKRNKKQAKQKQKRTVIHGSDSEDKEDDDDTKESTADSEEEDSDDDEEGSVEEGPVDLNADLGDFIEPDDATEITRAETEAQMPIEFTRHGKLQFSEHFRFFVHYLVHSHFLPKSRDIRKNREFVYSIQQVRQYIDSVVNSSIASSIWNAKFRTALDERPIIDVELIELSQGCQGCNGKDKIASNRATLSGTPYDPETWYDYEKSDSDSDEEDEDDEKEEVEIFDLGRFCARRCELHHALRHFMYDTAQEVRQKCSAMDKLPLEADMPKDRDARRERRSQEARRIIRHLESRDENYIEERYASLKSVMQAAKRAYLDNSS